MEGFLIALTAVLVVLTGALIFYARRTAHSSDELRKAVEKLRKTEEEVAEIGLTQIGATLEKTVTIPKTFLDEDLERLESNMSVLKSSPTGMPHVKWSWDENTLKITYRLNKPLDVLSVLQTNAREPELILETLVSDPIDVLLIRSRVRAQDRTKELRKSI